MERREGGGKGGKRAVDPLDSVARGKDCAEMEERWARLMECEMKEGSGAQWRSTWSLYLDDSFVLCC